MLEGPVILLFFLLEAFSYISSPEWVLQWNTDTVLKPNLNLFWLSSVWFVGMGFYYLKEWCIMSEHKSPPSPHIQKQLDWNSAKQHQDRQEYNYYSGVLSSRTSLSQRWHLQLLLPLIFPVFSEPVFLLAFTAFCEDEFHNFNSILCEEPLPWPLVNWPVQVSFAALIPVPEGAVDTWSPGICSVSQYSIALAHVPTQSSLFQAEGFFLVQVHPFSDGRKAQSCSVCTSIILAIPYLLFCS